MAGRRRVTRDWGGCLNAGRLLAGKRPDPQKRAGLGIGTDVDSADLQRVLFSRRWDNVVQAKVRDKLPVVVGDVPDGSNCHCKTGVVPHVLTLHLFPCAGVRHCREDLVAVSERITQIFEEL